MSEKEVIQQLTRTQKKRYNYLTKERGFEHNSAITILFLEKKQKLKRLPKVTSKPVIEELKPEMNIAKKVYRPNDNTTGRYPVLNCGCYRSNCDKLKAGDLIYM